MPWTTPTSDAKNISNASVTFDTTMRAGVQYVLKANTDLWYRTSATASVQAAVAGADENHFLARGDKAYLAKFGTFDKVTAIRDAADGSASLSEMVPGTSE